ncbi:MAG: ECF-type sigma factor [Thermoanaerobaculia bacterium]
MRTSAPTDLERALTAARTGEPEAIDRLVEALYPDLRRIARAQLRRLRPGRTLDTTSLVNEAYVKLVRGGEFADRSHFLAASARAMRHILVNAVRRRLAERHGSGRSAESLEGREVAAELAPYHEILDVAQALEALAAIDERLCRLVECRFYAGMTEEETAEALGISDRTVRRDWLRARAWLKEHLGRVPPVAPGEPA